MASSDGVITREDVIKQDALNWGPEYVAQINMSVAANKQMAASLKEINTQASQFRNAKSQEDYITLKQRQSLENQKIIDSNKQMMLSEANAEKVKQEVINTQKKQLELSNKIESSKKTSTKLTIEERAQIELNNRAIKQEVLSRLNLTEAYTKLNKERTVAKNKLRELIITEGESSKATKQAQKEFDALDQKVRKVDKAVGDFSKSIGDYKTAFGGLRDIFGAFGLVGGITGFISLAKDIFNTTKELQSLDLALKSVTGTQENFKEQQIFLNAIAGKYGLEINNLTKQYTAFYVAAKNKLAASQIQELFENIAKSGSALGLSNETLERSFVAINQMLAKGTVASEELRGQLAEALPGSVQAMVKAVQKLHPEIKNLTEKDLFELIKQGKILASEVLPETARQLVELTGADKAEGIDTLTKSTNRLKNEWIEFIRITSESDVGGFFEQSFRGATIIMSGFLDILKQVIASTQQLSNAEQSAGQGKGLLQFNEDFKNQSDKTPEQQKKFLEDLIKTQAASVKEYGDLVTSTNKKIEESNFSFFQRGLKRRAQGLAQQLGFERGILIAAQQKLEELNNPIKPAGSEEVDGVRIQAPRKRKLDDSEFQLAKQRLELAIQTQDQIAKNQELTDEERIKATEERSKKEIALIDLVKEREFEKNKEVYNNAVSFAKKKLESDLSNPKITEDGKAKAQNEFNNSVLDAKDELLNANEKIKINEKYAFDKIQIEKKTNEEIKKLREFDTKEYEAEIKRGSDMVTIGTENAIAEENRRFNELQKLGFENDKLKQKAAEDHERKLFNIKKAGLIAQAKLQINALTDEIDAYEAQSDGSQKSQDFILAKRAEVAKLSAQLTEAEGSVFNENEKKKAKEVQKQLEFIAETSKEVLGALADLSNAFSERKIQEIDEEIDKNNEYYDNQIKLAGDDEKQKELLEQERAKKEAVLEKKKRKEQEKQAKFDKAVTIAQIAIATALAVIRGFAESSYVGAAFAAVLGAIQLATAIATPIPKYKTGRIGGPREKAIVGDGGVPEVIERKSGKIELTPARNTLVELMAGDNVYKDIDDFKRNGRHTVLSGNLLEQKKMNEYHNITIKDNGNSKEVLKELKLTRKAIQKQKLIAPESKQQDLNHELWKYKNVKS